MYDCGGMWQYIMYVDMCTKHVEDVVSRARLLHNRRVEEQSGHMSQDSMARAEYMIA